jgi:hypothetical protein
MKRFLGMTQEEITENETLWREENGENLKPTGDAAGALRGIGVSPGAVSGEMAGQTAEAPPDMAAAAETAAAAPEGAAPPAA